MEQAFTPYSEADWFNGKDVPANCVQYVGRRDVRQTDTKEQIFEGFTLSCYCVLRQDAQTLMQVLYDERDICIG